MEPAETVPPPPRPSRTPSWLMLGFLLGALFVLAWPRRNFRPAPAPAPPVLTAEPIRRMAPPAPQLTTIEAVFAQWDRYAVWDNDITEVALWNAATKDFSDCYEVLRSGDDTYFRSIPRLTRPAIIPGPRVDCPLQFTETEDQRKARLRSNAEELWQSLKAGK
jgi:hypothetical protein